MEKDSNSKQSDITYGNLLLREELQTYLTESPQKIPIIFRDTIAEIPTTTYGTFSIYKYPAKFIPQVIAYVLKRYAKKGMRIFDPFAVYGNVGVVSRIYGYDYILWDLNSSYPPSRKVLNHLYGQIVPLP